MALASEILSRAHEGLTGPFPALEDGELLQRLEQINEEIHLVRMLTGLNSAETVSTDNRNSILIFKEDGSLEVKSFKEAPDALRELFRLERDFPTLDVVLVKADTNEEIRMAFKNYFSDAKDFIRLLTEGQSILGKAI